MREVLVDRLWTANAREARDTQLLFSLDISAVVDLAYEEPLAQLPRQLVYCRFPIVDGPGNDLSLLRLALLTTVELIKTDARTVVACSAGMSRSPTIAICALAIHLRKRPEALLAEMNADSALELHGELWTTVSQIAVDLQAS